MNKILRTSVPYAISAAALFLAGIQVAHGIEYAPLTTIPGVLKAGQATNPVSVIKGLYGIAIGAGSVIAVVMIILAGFKYMYEESISGKSGAKEQIENAFLGLLVILGSYILLRTINADLVDFNPELPGGVGGVSGLVASDQQFAAAQAQIHAAQTQVATINTDITNLDGQIADLKASIGTTTLAAATSSNPAVVAQLAQLNQLQAQKDAKSAQAAFMTGAALANNSTAVVEAYLNNPSPSQVNVQAYYASGLNGLDSAKSKLEDIYARTHDPAVQKQINDITLQRHIFEGDGAQLKAINDYKTGEDMVFLPEGGSYRTETPQSVAAAIRRTGDSTVAYLQQQNRSAAEISQVQAATTRRVHLICPSCN